MRVLRLDVTRFGPLADAHFALDGRLFVVLGPNETGKSSFHQAFETVFYGFDPATREAHPYAVWDPAAGPLAIEAELELDGGQRLRVERVLQSSPGLRLAGPGEEFRGRREGNGALPHLQSVPRDLFRAVYSLTANDTRFYKDEVREHVQELLLGETGLRGARPVRRVRAELAAELRRLWKPDNTGNPRSKRLGESLREARRTLREARRSERELAGEAEERAALEARLVELRERRRTLAAAADEAAFLGVLAELRRRADRVHPLRRGPLEGEPLVDPLALREEVEALERELAEPRARLAHPAPTLAPLHVRLLERTADLATARREATHHAEDRARREALVARASEAEDRARERLGRLGHGAPPPADELVTFPIDGLRAAAEAWAAAGQRGPSGRPPVWTLVAGALGLVLLGATAAAVVAPPWAGLGALLLIVPVAAALAGPPAPTRPADVERLLAELRLDPSVAAAPEALLAAAERLDEARTLLVDALALRGEAAELGRAAVARENRWRALAAEVGLAGGGSGATLLERLDEALLEARAAEDDLRDARTQRERDQAAVEAKDPLLAARAARLERVEAALAATFGDREPAAAHAAWLEAERDRAFVRERERELALDPRWERLSDDPRLDLTGDEAPWSTTAREARQREGAEVDDAIAAAEGRLGELRARLEGDPGSRVARAQEVVDALEAELGAVRREHDRLALLEQVLAEAERRHREAHQPDVLRRASEYLRAVTDGRYGRLDYPEGEGSELFVECAERGEAVPVGAPLSRGTREQVYLCLRLGTLDYLDQGRESLPLLLDEALVHWDAARRRRLYPVLAQVAERRQVVLFTCHPELAQEVRAALDVAVIDLARPAPSPVALNGGEER